MGESSLYSLIIWSIVTGVAMLVVGFSYRMYLKRHADDLKNEYGENDDSDTGSDTTNTLDTSSDGSVTDTLGIAETPSNTSFADPVDETHSQSSSETASETPPSISYTAQNNSSIADASDDPSSNNSDLGDTKTAPTKSKQIDD